MGKEILLKNIFFLSASLDFDSSRRHVTFEKVKREDKLDGAKKMQKQK